MALINVRNRGAKVDVSEIVWTGVMNGTTPVEQVVAIPDHITGGSLVFLLTGDTNTAVITLSAYLSGLLLATGESEILNETDTVAVGRAHIVSGFLEALADAKTPMVIPKGDITLRVVSGNALSVGPFTLTAVILHNPV